MARSAPLRPLGDGTMRAGVGGIGPAAKFFPIELELVNPTPHVLSPESRSFRPVGGEPVTSEAYGTGGESGGGPLRVLQNRVRAFRRLLIGFGKVQHFLSDEAERELRRHGRNAGDQALAQISLNVIFL